METNMINFVGNKEIKYKNNFNAMKSPPAKPPHPWVCKKKSWKLHTSSIIKNNLKKYPFLLDFYQEIC